jgi:hypothetical protein
MTERLWYCPNCHEYGYLRDQFGDCVYCNVPLVQETQAGADDRSQAESDHEREQRMTRGTFLRQRLDYD